MHHARAGFLGRCLQGDPKVDGLQLMLDERSAGCLVLAAPRDIGEGRTIALDQQAGAAISESIGIGCRAYREAVELGARAVDIAGVKKAGEAIVGAVEGAADQGGDVGGAEETVAGEMADDENIVVGQPERRRFRRTAEPRTAG